MNEGRKGRIKNVLCCLQGNAHSCVTAELGHLRVDRSQGKRLEGQPRGLSLQAYHLSPNHQCGP